MALSKQAYALLQELSPIIADAIRQGVAQLGVGESPWQGGKIIGIDTYTGRAQVETDVGSIISADVVTDMPQQNERVWFVSLPTGSYVLGRVHGTPRLLGWDENDALGASVGTGGTDLGLSVTVILQPQRFVHVHAHVPLIDTPSATTNVTLLLSDNAAVVATIDRGSLASGGTLALDGSVQIPDLDDGTHIFTVSLLTSTGTVSVTSTARGAGFGVGPATLTVVDEGSALPPPAGS